MRTVRHIIVFAFCFLVACGEPVVKNQNIAEVILKDTSSYFYIDAANYPSSNNSLPIGIFDSGTGGLTVLDAIVKFDKHNNISGEIAVSGDGVLDFQKESFIYLGDMANMPYGQYSSHGKTELLKEHIIKDVQFLLGNKYYGTPASLHYATDKSPVKALVIACNTATAYGKEDIEKFLTKAGIDMKVIGVIGAGVRGSLSKIKQDEDVSVGVLATFGTVSSNGYLNELQSTHKKLNYTGKLKVFQQAGIGWAGAIDGTKEYIASNATNPRDEYKGPSIRNNEALIDTSILQRYNFDWTDNNMLFDGATSNPRNIQINSIYNYTSYHIVSLLEQVIHDEQAPPLKSVILGCTHYPFYTDQIRTKLNELYNYRENGEFIYRDKMVENIDIIDPAVNTSKELYNYLKSDFLFNESDLSKSEFYISKANRDNPNNQVNEDGNFIYEYKYGRNVGYIQEYVKRVPFSKSNLGHGAIEMLSNNAPFTFELIKKFINENPKTEAFPGSEKLN